MSISKRRSYNELIGRRLFLCRMQLKDCVTLFVAGRVFFGPVYVARL